MPDKVIEFPKYKYVKNIRDVKPKSYVISIDKDINYLIEYKGKTYSLSFLLEKLINLDEGDTYA